jgi:hypothetical protein
MSTCGAIPTRICRVYKVLEEPRIVILFQKSNFFGSMAMMPNANIFAK